MAKIKMEDTHVDAGSCCVRINRSEHEEISDRADCSGDHDGNHHGAIAGWSLGNQLLPPPDNAPRYIAHFLALDEKGRELTLTRERILKALA